MKQWIRERLREAECNSPGVPQQPHGRKRCRACREWKDISLYYSRASKVTGRKYFELDCNSCRKVRYIVRNYGITPEEYHRLISKSGGLCECCKESYRDKPAIDHDHTTGSIRGVLCTSCNTSLGFARESVSRLRAMIDYLIRHTAAK